MPVQKEMFLLRYCNLLSRSTIRTFCHLYCWKRMWTEEGSSLTNEVHVFRLSKGKDLKKSIASYCTTHSIHAGLLISCAGSLTGIRIRLAQNDEVLDVHDGVNMWEIVSLSALSSLIPKVWDSLWSLPRVSQKNVAPFQYPPAWTSQCQTPYKHECRELCLEQIQRRISGAFLEESPIQAGSADDDGTNQSNTTEKEWEHINCSILSWISYGCVTCFSPPLSFLLLIGRANRNYHSFIRHCVFSVCCWHSIRHPSMRAQRLSMVFRFCSSMKLVA